jgi:alanine racemase
MKSRLTIDLAAVAQNVDSLRTRTGSRLCAMLKANGYGTCATTMARCLSACGIDLFGVADIDEAVALRRAGIKEEILILYVQPSQAEQVARYNLQPAVDNLPLIDALDAQATPLRVHLHIDTGFARLGCDPSQAHALTKRIERSSHLELYGSMTHLTGAEDDAQLSTFFAHTPNAPWLHVAATRTAVTRDIPGCNLVRIGLGLYGLHPAFDSTPALTLTTHLAAIHDLPQGATVSYGGHRLKRPTRVGVIPMGYYDGIHRFRDVEIDGHRHPILGAICMDFFMIDAGDAQPGATVHLPLADDPYHRITNLGPRVQRVFVNKSAPVATSPA